MSGSLIGTLVIVLSLCNCDAVRLFDTIASERSRPNLASASTWDSVLKKNLSSLLDIKALSFKQLASKYGHPAKEYEVTTEDGYELTVFRLPGTRKALPVLLIHGIADCSDTWVIRGNASLAITLANAKNDVWLANVRGNRYSRRHIRLDPDAPSYWNFSFHEIAVYDMATTIDLILNETGAAKLNAFGHSQGNMIFYVLLSTRTEYNAKVNVVTALAPVCYIHHVPPPIGVLLKASPLLHQLSELAGWTSVFGDDSIQNRIFRALSQIPVLGYAIDANILFAVCGLDKEEFEPEFLPVAGLYFPTWTSVKSLLHYAQIGVQREFRQYDYGRAGNVAVYNSLTPPSYDLSKVTAKVALLAARNDKFSRLEDVAILRRQLPNVVQYVVNPRWQMNHLDYVWGRTANHYLFKYIFHVLEKYK